MSAEDGGVDWRAVAVWPLHSPTRLLATALGAALAVAAVGRLAPGPAPSPARPATAAVSPAVRGPHDGAAGPAIPAPPAGASASASPTTASTSAAGPDEAASSAAAAAAVAFVGAWGDPGAGQAAWKAAVDRWAVPGFAAVLSSPERVPASVVDGPATPTRSDPAGAEVVVPTTSGSYVVTTTTTAAGPLVSDIEPLPADAASAARS